MFIRFFFLFLFIPFFVNAQYEKKIDSLHDMYNLFKNNDLNKSKEYAAQAYKISKLNVVDSLTLISSNNYIEALYKKGEYDLAEKINIELFELAKKYKNEKFLCLSYLHFGNLKRRKREFTASLENFEIALDLSQKNNLIELEHRVLNSKSILFKNTKNYEKAIYILKNNLKRGDFNNHDNIAYTYNTLASSYFKLLKERDSSIFFYRKGTEILKKTNNDYLKIILYVNLGDILLHTDNRQEGLKYLLLAKESAKRCGNYKALYTILVSLGIYHKKSDYKKAISLFEEAYFKYGKYKGKRSIANLYWILSETYYENNQPKEAYLYQEKLIYLKDSLFDIEKNKTFERLQTEYEVEKKNDQIEFLEKEQVLEAKQKKLIYGIGGLLFIGLMLLVFVYRYREKSQKVIRKQEQLLYDQEKEQLKQTQTIKRIESYIAGEEKEKNRIALELHDGIGGQLAGIKHFVSSLQQSHETDELRNTITNVSKEVRLLSHSLSTNFSTQQPLPVLLKTLKDRYKNHFDIQINLYPEDEIQRISTTKKLFLYRTIQELVNNVYKYAKASLVDVSITISEEIILMVEDNGIGFDTTSTLNGIGLANIKERVSSLEGTFELNSVPKKGTSIVIIIPNENAQD